MHFSVTLALALGVFSPFALASPGEDEIARKLQYSVNMQEPPEVEGDNPVTVKFGVSLINVLRADPDTNQVELVLWVSTEWRDERLKFGFMAENVSMVRFESSDMWYPDVTLYTQTAAPEYFIQDQMNMVSREGTVYAVRPGKFKAQCDLAGLETSAGAKCTLKFGSWTASSEDLNLQFLDEPRHMDLSEWFVGSKYEVTENTARRNVKTYACCPQAYVDLEFHLSIRTKGSGGSIFGLFD